MQLGSPINPYILTTSYKVHHYMDSFRASFGRLLTDFTNYFNKHLTDFCRASSKLIATDILIKYSETQSIDVMSKVTIINSSAFFSFSPIAPSFWLFDWLCSFVLPTGGPTSSNPSRWRTNVTSVPITIRPLLTPNYTARLIWVPAVYDCVILLFTSWIETSFDGRESAVLLKLWQRIKFVYQRLILN